MARLAEPIKNTGRVTLFYDEVHLIRHALRKLLKTEKHTLRREMLIHDTYNKLKYANEAIKKSPTNRQRSKADQRFA